MFEAEIILNEFNRQYLTRLMAGFEEQDLDVQPHPDLHSMRWILAHLAIVVDYGMKQLELPFVCPLAWHAAYGPASKPGTSAKVRPTAEELLSSIERGYAQLCEALRCARADQLDVRHEVDLLKNTALISKRDLLSHILATHFATHLGQLSTLRRMAGHPPLF